MRKKNGGGEPAAGPGELGAEAETRRPLSDSRGATADHIDGRLVDAARQLGSFIAGHSEEIDRQGSIPDSVVAALKQAGFYRMTTAREIGGLDRSHLAAASVVEELARHDASVAWCILANDQTKVLSRFLQSDVAARCFGGDQVVAGWSRPNGEVRQRRSGMARVSGRWGFASGSSNADWFVGRCLSTPSTSQLSPETTVAVVFPRQSVTLHGNWSAIGLRGTASQDFSVDDVWIPEDQIFQPEFNVLQDHVPISRALPILTVSQGALAIGIARAILLLAHRQLLSRMNPKSGPAVQSTSVQGAFGEARVTVLAAKAGLYSLANELWQQALESRSTDPRLRGRVRLATSFAQMSSVRAAELVRPHLGTNSVMSATSPFERNFRDLLTAGTHLMAGPLSMEAGGRVELGLSPDFPWF